MTNQTIKITVETTVNATAEKLWKIWTTPEDIIKWNNASVDWHTSSAENDLKNGGNFLFRMEAKDGSFGFDFCGIYDNIKINELIEYTIADGRKVKITFTQNENQTKIIETFDAENENPVEMQRFGWQAILDNFKTYSETN